MGRPFGFDMKLSSPPTPPSAVLLTQTQQLVYENWEVKLTRKKNVLLFQLKLHEAYKVNKQFK